MQKTAKLMKWSLPAVVIPVITLVFFIGEPLIFGGNVNASKSAATPLSSNSGKNWPKYNPLPRVDPPADPTDRGDMVYHGGPVIDGTANIYLIFWIDATFQAPIGIKLRGNDKQSSIWHHKEKQ